AYMRNQPVPVAIDQLLQESGDAAPLIIEALIYEGSTLNLIELVKAELSSQADKAHADSNISELLKRIQAVRRTAECGEVFAALIKDDKTAILVAKYLELIAEEDGFSKDLMRNLGVKKLPTESSASRVDNLIASSLKILQESKSEHYFVRLAHLAKENNLKNSFRRIAALTSSVSSSHNDTIMLLRFKHEFGEGDEFENYCGALTLSWTSEALKNLIVEFANGKEDLLAARIAFESLRSGSLNRTALVKLLLRERGLVLTFVYYYYTHYHLPFDDLTQDIIKASSMTTIKSPVDQLFADEYFISIAQASRSLGGRKKVELTKWTAAVNENMITKYGHRIDNRAVLS
ncbi:MAG: hypothetical protein K2Z81_22090, partial [Cyanobacteria bacterium]|nr:hypothetical protein [Cyanobacteriota bacterium]